VLLVKKSMAGKTMLGKCWGKRRQQLFRVSPVARFPLARYYNGGSNCYLRHPTRVQMAKLPGEKVGYGLVSVRGK
jgi:hypothetical protein